MTYKAVCFFDLDGTLLNEQHQVDDEVRAAIAQLKENNILPIIATGRAVSQLSEIKKQADIQSVVALNGAYIEVDGKMIHEEVIPTQVVERFVDFSNSINKEISFVNADKVWINELSEYIEKAYAAFDIPLPLELPNHFLDTKVHMLLAMSDEKEKDIYYHEAFPELNFFRNSISTVDVVKKGTDKGSGVAKILEYLGHTDIPTYAFGDGPNDIALLKAVDYGVAMGNGVAEAKEVADFVTAKNTEGGLIQAFKHFELI